MEKLVTVLTAFPPQRKTTRQFTLEDAACDMLHRCTAVVSGMSASAPSSSSSRGGIILQQRRLETTFFSQTSPGRGLSSRKPTRGRSHDEDINFPGEQHEQMKSAPRHNIKNSSGRTSDTTTSFAIIYDGGTQRGDSGPYLKRDPNDAINRPNAYLAAQMACDSSGGIRLGKDLIARDGKFCDSPEFPLHTVCVKDLPMDWCPSVRPKTTFLPPKWRPVFVKEKPVNYISGIDSMSPDYYQNNPKAAPTDVINRTEMQVVADQGDVCCPKRTKLARSGDLPGDKSTGDDEGGEGIPIRNCEDHWGKPWCVTPAALYRYMINHPRWQVNVDCAATSQPRIGVLGAICDQQDRQRLSEEAFKHRMGEPEYAKQYETLMNKEEMVKGTTEGKEALEKTQQKDPALFDASSEKPEKAPGGSEPGFYGPPDPRRTSGGLGVGLANASKSAPLIRPGADFGVYGGQSAYLRGGLRPGTTPAEERPEHNQDESGGLQEPPALADTMPESSTVDPVPGGFPMQHVTKLVNRHAGKMPVEDYTQPPGAPGLQSFL